MAEKLVMTVDEAANLLGISRGLAYAAVRDGRLPHLRIGRRILVSVAALERLVEEVGHANVMLTPPATLVGA